MGARPLVIPAPAVIEHDGIHVVRDDLIGGGTKARYIARLFEGGAEEIVYASPAEGGAQTALAWTAAQFGKRATIFVAKRAQPHPRALMAKRLGALVMQVSPGYLAVVQARARAYCDHTGATLAPFGMDVPEAIEVIADAARATGLEPDEVWCASGSGVLARWLAAAWPQARRHVVQVGRALDPSEVAGATIHVYPRPFGQEARMRPPFPSDPHYDAKAWEMLMRFRNGERTGSKGIANALRPASDATARRGAGLAIFWNVTGPAA